MAWNSVAASSSVIDHDEWNSMVTYITDDAADLATHTSDSTIHFTVDSINLDELSDVSAPSPTSGNSLIWNGIAWIDAFVSGQGSNIAGNPAGIDTQVQFNDNGNFGADSNFTWNSITNTLNIAGSISSQKISSNKILTSEINSVNNLYISSLTDNINIIAYDSLYLKSKWKGIHLYAPYEGISISSLNGDIKVYADGTNIIINTERISGGSFLPIWPREVINKRWAERQFKPSTATGDGGTGG
ncbi:MAG: hypothetical protein IMZ59_03750, partial [Actinobacteria bacterium]|nr:hypothetical protein [Actinomycetota bacterium]